MHLYWIVLSMAGPLLLNKGSMGWHGQSRRYSPHNLQEMDAHLTSTLPQQDRSDEWSSGASSVARIRYLLFSCTGAYLFLHYMTRRRWLTRFIPAVHTGRVSTARSTEKRPDKSSPMWLLSYDSWSGFQWVNTDKTYGRVDVDNHPGLSSFS